MWRHSSQSQDLRVDNDAGVSMHNCCFLWPRQSNQQCLNITFTLLSPELGPSQGPVKKVTALFKLPLMALTVSWHLQRTYCMEKEYLEGARNSVSRDRGSSEEGDWVAATSSGYGMSSGGPNARSTYARSLSETLSLFSWGDFHNPGALQVAPFLSTISCSRKMSLLSQDMIFEGSSLLKVPRAYSLRPPFRCSKNLGLLRRTGVRISNCTVTVLLQLRVLSFVVTNCDMVLWSQAE